MKTRMRIRAEEHQRSMEEEVRVILRDAVSRAQTDPQDLVKLTKECFASIGGVDLELPKRGSMREPPNFADDFMLVIATNVVSELTRSEPASSVTS